ncbi:MAG: hypothetical protein CMJ78_06445 [Planctomycetaceae bacterium]|nr:hypothetical protein [Planctomycetaceae bacterium]
MKGEKLFFELRMQDGLPSSSDPDIRNRSQTDDGSVEACTADDPAESNWGDWQTFVFSRQPI